jgi:two-component system nitrogen regulation response regulator GlnG
VIKNNIMPQSPSKNSQPLDITRAGLSDLVRSHIQDYFLAHNGELPVSGLYKCVLTEVERPLFQIVLDAVKGNQAKASEILGINRNTFRKKVAELGIVVAKRTKF